MSVRYAPSKRYAPYVKALMECGHWSDAETTTGGHVAQLVHNATGQTVAYALHDGGNEWNAGRNFAKQAGDICGCTFIQPRGRKRSRKAVERTDFDIVRARRENEQWHESQGANIDALQTRHADAALRLDELSAGTPSRADLAEARQLCSEITETEAALTRLCQPFTPYGGIA